MLDHKLGITDLTESARTEEKISKLKTMEVFENGSLENWSQERMKVLRPFINMYLMKLLKICRNECSPSVQGRQWKKYKNLV